MPLPISPDPDSESRSSSPDDAAAKPVGADVAAAEPVDSPVPSPAAVASPAPLPARSHAARQVFFAGGRMMIQAAAVGFACLAYAYLTLPDVRPLRATNPTTTAFMELRADDARSRGEPPRRFQKWTRYRDISSDLKRAVLASEDDAFWQHEGIDFEQLQESLEIDWAHGRIVRGGSTITQQLAKTLYLSPSKNPIRKLRELIIP